MKQFRAYRFLAVAMAMLLLFSSTGIAMDRHFCNGELKSVSFTGVAPTCHDEARACKYHQAPQQEQQTDQNRDCCNNQQDFLKLDTDMLTDQINCSVNLELPSFDLAALLDPEPRVYRSASAQHSYLNYKPPAWSRDLCTLFQCFLL